MVDSIFLFCEEVLLGRQKPAKVLYPPRNCARMKKIYPVPLINSIMWQNVNKGMFTTQHCHVTLAWCCHGIDKITPEMWQWVESIHRMRKEQYKLAYCFGGTYILRLRSSYIEASWKQIFWYRGKAKKKAFEVKLATEFSEDQGKITISGKCTCPTDHTHFEIQVFAKYVWSFWKTLSFLISHIVLVDKVDNGTIPHI